MSTEGIQALFLTTHNWGRSAHFFQSLGFELEFDTGHHSGQLRNGSGPYLFIAEVPEHEAPQMQAVIAVTNEADAPVDAAIDVVTPFESTHWGTREMTVRDPDGRIWRLQAPASK